MPVLAGGRVVVRDRVLDPGWVEVVGDRLTAVGPGVPPAGHDIDLGGRVLVPGFVDLHVHGGGGASYSSASVVDVTQAAAFHRRHGTTTSLASLVTAPIGELVDSIGRLAALVRDGRLAGVHLEGPWLAPARRGAHAGDLLRPPTPSDVGLLMHTHPGVVRMVTLAPELPRGIRAIHEIVAAGAVAAVGHTDATYAETLTAVTAGASAATHLCNAMRPIHHREPGPALALLERSDVTIELVADGVHLHPAVLRHVIASAGPDRVCLVTDAMAAAGQGDGDYLLGGLPVRVTGGVARLTDGGAIAGSTLTMDAAFGYVVRHCGISMEAAARMTATTPARVLGLSDRGVVEAGRRADIVVLDADFRAVDVMVAGRWVS